MSAVEPLSDWRFCVAPMMGCTDRHYRYFARLLSRRARLYTEMLVAAALTHGDAERLLRHDPDESPVALQLGGSDPQELGLAAALGAAAGYDEINLNVGCPSDRVQAGKFGACLIAEPSLVAECVAAMRAAVCVPVTVKTRLGVDAYDSYDHLAGLIEGIQNAGCRVVILHARKAILGLNTRDNRLIPPLDHARVHRIKRDFPTLQIVVNGGLTNLASSIAQLAHVDGVMLGRSAYDNPMLLQTVDAELFGQTGPVHTETSALAAFLPYLEREVSAGVALRQMTRHLLGLFAGQPGARDWRRWISEVGPRTRDARVLIEEALLARSWVSSNA